MTELVLPRQRLRQRQIPAKQIKTGREAGNFGCELAGGDAGKEAKNRRRLRRHSATASTQQPTTANQQPNVKI